MPIDCTGALTADILFDCENQGAGGIEQNVILINRDDIDRTLTTLDPTNNKVVSNITLKAGATGFKFTGVKQSNGKAYELVKKENAPDKWKHTFSGVIFSPTLANKTQANNMAQGSKYVVVVEQIFKGIGNKDAFEVLGYGSGLELMSMTNNSKENDNMIVFELSSSDGYEENTVAKTFLDGGVASGTYAASKTAFDNKFASE
ncbi:hypothetical protein Q765_03305 [Flavobacterium rivuli WB 3.3-2 = DSM 21788]|uniref:Uncharacterized protein n=1 Tax=Flavobacterium rivuli WB 3.3-2 = DSM 21788 TaxID=1121895 RepID=A0A0A2MIF2_9FLAO|nr:hypothetical protein [Flavobacterium rivuli]KGO88095.1 hypothetical protein Q765_03305 [Flavobacterium rivuli WB 3.3-2 = DSM 21788]